ncbi:hypothetical protein BDV28DRAFT_125848 [Aspergillus coremiiformis]|uniref:Ketoreductase (KR) domain-containing protein n=1 Tax=Aspergillus coremiiformis TaxID=138285 RepID=A0A5N6Z432_9EURO|nr:hypothetical protein BDV28DRAFT_125848 [Aspergillus coremiiformis]
MPGTIIIPTVQLLLSKYPDYTLLLTVRNAPAIETLRAAIPSSQTDTVSFHELDLADLSAVHEFATTIAADINAGKLPPLASIVCNAFHWNLCRESELTSDGGFSLQGDGPVGAGEGDIVDEGAGWMDVEACGYGVVEAGPLSIRFLIHWDGRLGSTRRTEAGGSGSAMVIWE